MTGAISGGINTAAQSVATEQGAQSMQGQGQQMMQNQANKAYTDPSQFDGMMQNNAEAAAAHQQALSSYIGKNGMGTMEQGDYGNTNKQMGGGVGFLNNAKSVGMSPMKFGEMQAETGVSVSGSQPYNKVLGHGYGNMLDNGSMKYNATNGMFDGTSQMTKNQAEGFVNGIKENGLITANKAKQFDNVINNSNGLVSVGYQGLSNNGKPEFSQISLSNGTEAKTWSNASVADTNKIDGGTSVTEKGSGARPYLNKTPLASIFKGQKINGEFKKGGGVFAFNGTVNRQQAQGLISKGLISGKAATNMQDILNQNPKMNNFALQAGGNNNGLTGITVSNEQGTVLAREGNMTDYSLSKNGHTNENLHNTVNNSSTVNSSGTKNDKYHDNTNNYYGKSYNVPEQDIASIPFRNNLNALPGSYRSKIVSKGTSNRQAKVNFATKASGAISSVLSENYKNNWDKMTKQQQETFYRLAGEAGLSFKGIGGNAAGGVQGSTSHIKDHGTGSNFSANAIKNKVYQRYTAVENNSFLTPKQKTADLNKITARYHDLVKYAGGGYKGMSSDQAVNTEHLKRENKIMQQTRELRQMANSKSNPPKNYSPTEGSNKLG
ncbi:MAG: hypothetical protein ACYCTB_11360, partial [bacterium]